MIRLPIPKESMQSPGLLTGLLGREPKHNAFADVKNLILSGNFDRKKIEAIETHRGVDVTAEFRPELLGLFTEILYHFARDGSFERDETLFVKECALALRLAPPEVDTCLRRACERAFSDLCDEAIADGLLTSVEQANLERLAGRLRLSDSAKLDIYAKALDRRVQRLLREMTEDGLVSDQEYDAFRATCEHLKVRLSNLDEVDTALTLGRERWRVLHGQMLSATLSDINLDPDEVAYYRGKADWYETRKVRDRVDFAGITGRVRIAKGLSFRMGSVGYNAPSRDELLLIASGELVMTGKRLLFFSESGSNKSIRWREVLRVDINSHNEFELQKARGKSPVIDIRSASLGHPMLGAYVAARLVQDAGSPS